MQTLLKVWDQIEYWILGTLAFIASCLVTYSVIMRYVFRYPLGGWLLELVLYLVIWAGFISVSPLARDRLHIANTMLVDKLSSKGRRVIDLLNNLLSFGFCVALVFIGLKWVSNMKRLGFTTVTGLSLPIWIAYMIIPIFGILVALRYVQQIYRVLRREKGVDKELLRGEI